jgi:ABC-2 type transport system permease protein
LGLASLFIVTALGIGIFISSFAKTQLEAFLMTFATILPAMFLSGLFFPIEAMPGWLQLVTYVVPARYGLVIIRSILLKGAGLEILMEQVVAIIIFSLVIVTLASTRFRKKLE